MDAQSITIISGFVLLVVFALVGLNLRRRTGRHRHKEPPPENNG